MLRIFTTDGSGKPGKNFRLVISLLFILILFLKNGAACHYTDTLNIMLYEDSSKIYNNLGRESMINGDFEIAEFYFLKSLNIRRVYLKNDLSRIASGYVNLGANYYSMWRFDDALENYKKAEEIYAEKIDSFQTDMGILETNKGILLSNTGDYHNAKFHLEIALKYFDKDVDKLANYYKTYVLNSMGTVYLKLKEFNKSILYFKECISLSKKYNTEMVSTAYGNLAIVYIEMDGYSDKAEYYLKHAIEYNIRNKGYGHYQLISQYNIYADFLIKQNKNIEAKKYYLKSLKIIKINNISFHPSKAYAYLGLGDIFIAASKPDSALYYYQRSIAALVPGFEGGDPDIEKTISKTHLLKCLKQRAAAYYHRFNLSGSLDDLVSSLKSYDLAIRLIDLIRLGYQDQNSRLFLSENEENTYHEALYTAQKLWGLTSDRYYLNKAFEYSERGKSSLLLATIRDAGAKGFGGIPDELLGREKELVRDIAFYKEQIYEESRNAQPNRAKLDLWEKTLFDLTNQNEQLIKQFENEYPKYHALKYNTGVTTIDVAAGKLAGDCSLLEYTLTDSLLYIFVIGRSQSEIIMKPVDSIFFQTLSELIKSVKKLDFTNHTQRDFLSYYHAATSMHNYLIAPALPYIKSKHLIIIPDDILSFLPFEILLGEQPESDPEIMDYKNLDYLVRKFAVSYAYSSTMLFENQWDVKKTARKGLLAFAPVYNGRGLFELRGISRSAYRKNLAPIPGAREEVEKIVKITRGDAFIDGLATEPRFKASSSDYDILHLAMHTIIDDDNPMFSKLVFSHGSDTAEDGFLNTYEIFNLNLRARLAILSSCSSGEGLLKRGEGVVSLARGFAYAGCPGLLMTLWELEDKTGVDMMVGFYKNLKMGHRKDVALQKAKIRFIESGNQIKAHPFYWSSYISIGDQSALYHPAKKYAFILLALSALIILIIFKRQCRKRSC